MANPTFPAKPAVSDSRGTLWPMDGGSCRGKGFQKTALDARNEALSLFALITELQPRASAEMQRREGYADVCVCVCVSPTLDC